MRNVVLGLGVLLIGMSVAQAQSEKKEVSDAIETSYASQEDKANQLTSKMAKELNLNEDQTAQLKTINIDFFQKMAYLKSEYKGDDSHVEFLETNRDNEIKDILDKGQFRHYMASKTPDEKHEHKAKRKDHKAGHHAKLDNNQKKVN